MSVFLRRFGSLVPEKHYKPQNHRERKRSLQVTISKDPPVVQYFVRDTLEDSFECIFDPLVHHDEEKDHPDLERKKPFNKPWKDVPCTNSPSNVSLLFRKLGFSRKVNPPTVSLFA